jgi:hypothetical protein
MTEVEGGYPKIKVEVEKLGYQAPKGRRLNSGFMTIDVKDMHYCYSHDFWYNPEEQDKLLHEGKACFYTDGYAEGGHNYYREGSMGRWRRGGGITLKRAKRMIRRTRNLPVGTIVNICHNCYGIGKKSRKSFSLGYRYKVTKENKFNPDYQVNRPSFFRNFTIDDKAKELVDLLRANGFLVSVSLKNPNFISSMISSAAAAIGKDADVIEESGEYATAYGHGLRVGCSSNKDTFRGYSCGSDNILFDKWDEFDKWSRCREISKETSNQEILHILLEAEGESKYSD